MARRSATWRPPRCGRRRRARAPGVARSAAGPRIAGRRSSAPCARHRDMLALDGFERSAGRLAALPDARPGIESNMSPVLSALDAAGRGARRPSVHRPKRERQMIDVIRIGSAAGAPGRPDQLHHCDDPQTQSEMNACAALDFERADAELNAAYRARSSMRARATATRVEPPPEGDDRPGRRPACARPSAPGSPSARPIAGSRAMRRAADRWSRWSTMAAARRSPARAPPSCARPAPMGEANDGSDARARASCSDRCCCARPTRSRTG